MILTRCGVATITVGLLLSVTILLKISQADPSLERQKELLEKGLTLHEIDRELDRIEERERMLEAQILGAQEQLKVQEAKKNVEKQRAGEVLRAYYTGERDSFFSAFLQMQQLSEFLTVLEYVQIIFDSDRQAIERYTTSTEALEQTITALQQTEAELADVKQLYLQKKQVAIQTKQTLEEARAAMAHPTEFDDQLSELTQRWETEGLPLFRTYFRTLAKAMNDLPEMLEDGDHLTMKGLTWEFRMKDSDLNTFLRTKDDLFEQIAFRFEEDQMIAEGTADGHSIFISGQYAIFDEPSHHIGFDISQLEYEGFSLPESTVLEMEEQFDLSFYPKAMIPFVKATKLTIQNHELNIKLELDR